MRKPEAQSRHALKRAHQRYGKAFRKQDLAQMRNLIWKGESSFIRKLSCSRSQHCVNYQGQNYMVVYDKSRNQICTFLPEE